MTDRCMWKRDKKIGRWFLPGCMGGAVHGPDGCTCKKPSTESRIEKLERELADVKNEMRELEKRFS